MLSFLPYSCRNMPAPCVPEFYPDAERRAFKEGGIMYFLREPTQRGSSKPATPMESESALQCLCSATHFHSRLDELVERLAGRDQSQYSYVHRSNVRLFSFKVFFFSVRSISFVPPPSLLPFPSVSLPAIVFHFQCHEFSAVTPLTSHACTHAHWNRQLT